MKILICLCFILLLVKISTRHAEKHSKLAAFKNSKTKCGKECCSNGKIIQEGRTDDETIEKIWELAEENFNTKMKPKENLIKE